MPADRLPSLPDWPALMGEATAAAYLDVSAGHFRKHCPVPPVQIGGRKLYPREAIDAWWRAKAGIIPVAGSAEDWSNAINGGM